MFGMTSLDPLAEWFRRKFSSPEDYDNPQAIPRADEAPGREWVAQEVLFLHRRSWQIVTVIQAEARRAGIIRQELAVIAKHFGVRSYQLPKRLPALHPDCPIPEYIRRAHARGRGVCFIPCVPDPRVNRNGCSAGQNHPQNVVRRMGF